MKVSAAENAGSFSSSHEGISNGKRWISFRFSNRGLLIQILYSEGDKKRKAKKAVKQGKNNVDKST